MDDITLNVPLTSRVGPNRFLELILRPRKAFQEITAANKSSWLLPMLLCSLGILLQVLAAGYLRTRAASLGEIPLPSDWEWWSPDMQNNYLQGIQTTQGPAYVYAIPAITGLLGLWLGWPILSSMLHLTSTLFGGRGSQKSTLNMVSWAYVPHTVRSMLRALYMLLANQVIASPGLSGFALSGSSPSLFWGNLLKQTDLFLVWQVLLLGVGLSQLNGLSRLKTWLAVLLVMLIVLLSVAGLSSIAASLSGTAIYRPF